MMNQSTEAKRSPKRRTWTARTLAFSVMAAGLLLGPVAVSAATADSGDPHEAPPVAPPPFVRARCHVEANQPEKVCWAIPTMTKMLRLHVHNPGTAPVLLHTNGAYPDTWVEVNEWTTFILAPGDHLSLPSQRWVQTIDIMRVED
jgi:hypothetical protein